MGLKSSNLGGRMEMGGTTLVHQSHSVVYWAVILTISRPLDDLLYTCRVADIRHSVIDQSQGNVCICHSPGFGDERVKERKEVQVTEGGELKVTFNVIIRWTTCKNQHDTLTLHDDMRSRDAVCFWNRQSTGGTFVHDPLHMPPAT
jgi:hypothetical protein